MEKISNDNTNKEANNDNNNEEDVKNQLKDLEEISNFISFKNKDSNKVKDQYKFWDTQPVPSFKENKLEEGPINNENKLDKVRKEPYNLPKSFEWKDIDIKNKDDLKLLYEFLRDNYVEDDDHMFRFDYSQDFLYWHLSAPGYLKQWHCAIFQVVNNTKIMAGFISAIPVHIQVKQNKLSLVEINFLCVKSTYRSKRIAPVLIKEITRRVNLQNIWQAVFTAGALLPKPIAKTNYYHRNLNLSKLLDIKFTYLNPKLNLARAKKIYNLSKETTINNLRPFNKKTDVNGVYEILEKYLSQFKIRPFYSRKEVEHWFNPIEKVVYSYVVENSEGKITDFLSFYLLPSSILQHDTHKVLYSAYSFFNVPGSVSLKELIRNALILAKNLKFDVYNALNVMENESVFNNLLFGKGDGSLKYYLYNYAVEEIQPNELGIVLM